MSDIAARLAQGRRDKLAKQVEKQNLQKGTLYQNLYNKLKTDYQQLQDDFKNLQKEVENLRKHEEMKAGIILQDLLDHIENKAAPYSSELISLAMEIKSLSSKAYSLLVNKMNFPKETLINQILNDVIKDIPSNLTNLDKCTEMIDLFRENNKLKKSETIEVCLAVDAVAFTPEMQITSNGEVKGVNPLTAKTSISPRCFSLFSKDPIELEKFIKANSNEILKAGFVFQVQPYDIMLQPFVIHVYPTVNGKGNETIVELLHKIRKICKSRNLTVKSYAFDGDTAYMELHKLYYESYIHKAVESEKFNYSSVRVFRVVSDFLHIIKRLRYRLLSSIIHCGFDEKSDAIDLDHVKSILSKSPDVVWCNELYTKMHDRLPLELFKIENFLALVSHGDLTAAAFWFPISISILAINAPDIGFENRRYLLETAFWFLVFYFDCWENDEVTLRSKKYKGDLHVTFFTRELLMEFTNTIHCHLQLMSTVKKFSYDRNSTTPLEHKFGQARIRAHDKHTLTKFLRTLSLLQAVNTGERLQELNKFQQDLQIRGRTNSFGVTVENPEDDNIFSAYDDNEEFSLENEKRYTAVAFAKAMLSLAGFDVQYSPMVDPETIMEWGIDYLTRMADDIPTKRKQSRISDKKINFGILKVNKSQKRVYQSQPTKQNVKEKIVDSILQERFGPTYTKKDLIRLFDALADSVDPPKLPKRNCKKEVLLQYLVDNLALIYEFLVFAEIE